jgi:hypothetical protein
MSNRKRIWELPQKDFDSEIINNCFFVDEINTPNMSAVPLKSVFDEIIKRAKQQGLVVQMQSDSIAIINYNNTDENGNTRD